MTDQSAGLRELAPVSPDYRIDWAAVEGSLLRSLIGRMKRTQQDALWHGEGNVWNHVRLVCESLVSMEDYRAMDRHMQEMMFLSALLHDIGKIPTTQVKDGRIRTPRHGEVGSRMARAFLWQQCGLLGTREKMLLRETICRMIRYHMAPPHMLYGDTYRVRVPRIAAEGELVPDFTLRRLAMLSEADNRGRICSDLDEQLAMIERSAAFAREWGCYDGPARFADAHTERMFFAGADVQPQKALSDETWGEVILLCGLSERARERWIAESRGELPVISLEEGQSASECAKAHLAARRCFIWNAPNLTAAERAALAEQFERAGAGVSMIYAEDAERDGAAPAPEQLAVPERHEARRVEWLCI